MESACRGTCARSTRSTGSARPTRSRATELATLATGPLLCGSTQATTLTFDGSAMPGPNTSASCGDRVTPFGPSRGGAWC